IDPGCHDGRSLTVQDVFEAVGAHSRGAMSDEEFRAIENTACPGAGACGGQFTANTMATAIEFLGIAPLGRSSVPATHAQKDSAAREAGALVMDLVRSGLRPRQILTA